MIVLQWALVVCLTGSIVGMVVSVPLLLRPFDGQPPGGIVGVVAARVMPRRVRESPGITALAEGLANANTSERRLRGQRLARRIMAVSVVGFVVSCILIVVGGALGWVG